jgi:hypothetical protein
MVARRDRPRYRLEPDQPVELMLALDHGQFFVLDGDSEIDLDAYDEEAQRGGLACFDGGVVVLCESHWSSDTPLRMTLLSKQPSLDVDSHDHVVVGSITCRSGELRIFLQRRPTRGKELYFCPPRHMA